MKSLRIGLIGCGAWGKNILRTLSALGSLEAVCDTNPAALKAAAQQNPSLKAYSQPLQIFDDSKITAVAIASSSPFHYPLGRAALLAGKDVFMEKPLALSFAQGLELVQLAERNQKILMVGHILEYHPAVRALEKLIKTGELGELYYIYSSRLNLGKVRQEENILWSFAPHDIAVFLRLLGEIPLFVSTSGGHYLTPTLADVTLTSLTFPKGVRGHLFVSWLHPYKEQKLIVAGSKKMAIFDDTVKDGKLKLLDRSIHMEDGKPLTKEGKEQIISLEMEEPLKLELQHFLECLKTRREPRSSGRQALPVLRILEASQHSLSLGGHPVSIEELYHPRSISPNVIPTLNVSEGEGEKSAFYAHPTAAIDPQSKIGDETKIWHFCHIANSAEIGKSCVLGQNVYIGPGVKIGNNVKIQNNVSIYEGVVLEDDVFCGPSCVFTNVKNPRSHVSRRNEFRQTFVKKGATIGANATVICGVTIGEYAFIGAGATVTKDVPAYGLVHGSPARLQGWMCRCGEKVARAEAHEQGERTCSRCHSVYLITQDGAGIKPMAKSTK